VLLPEPMNPVRQTTRYSGTGPVAGAMDGEESCKRFGVPAGCKYSPRPER